MSYKTGGLVEKRIRDPYPLNAPRAYTGTGVHYAGDVLESISYNSVEAETNESGVKRLKFGCKKLVLPSRASGDRRERI